MAAVISYLELASLYEGAGHASFSFRNEDFITDSAPNDINDSVDIIRIYLINTSMLHLVRTDLNKIVKHETRDIDRLIPFHV